MLFRVCQTTHRSLFSSCRPIKTPPQPYAGSLNANVPMLEGAWRHCGKYAAGIRCPIMRIDTVRANPTMEQLGESRTAYGPRNRTGNGSGKWCGRYRSGWAVWHGGFSGSRDSERRMADIWVQDAGVETTDQSPTCPPTHVHFRTVQTVFGICW